MTRALLAVLLAGCTAQAAPPIAGGGAAPSVGSQSTLTTDQTLAGCQALTPAESDLCFPTDSPYTMVARVAGTWSYRYPGIGFDVTPPPSASWSAFNAGSIAASGGTRVNTVAAGATGTLRGEYRTQPALPFIVTACWDVPMPGTNGAASVGLGGTDGTGVAMIWDTDWNGTLAKPGGAVSRWSAHTTFVASDYDLAYTPTRIVCKRYMDDDSPAERSFYSVDPADGTATQIGAGLGRTVTITATSIGWWASTNDADAARRVRLVHWATGTP